MKKTAFFAALAIILSMLCLFVAADNDENAQVINDISPFMLRRGSDVVLNTFNDTNEGWDSDLKNTNVTLAEKIDTFPYKPLTGNGSLIVRAKNVQNGDRIYISKEYDEHLDLSGYNSMIFAVNCSEVNSADAIFTVEMYSDGDIFTTYCSIKHGGWNGVFADISGWADRAAVKRIRVSVALKGDAVSEELFEYYIDSISASSRENAANAVRFCADSYQVSAGQSSYENGVLNISGVTDEVRLDSVGFLYSDPEDSNGINIVFETEGMCTNVRLNVYDLLGNLISEREFTTTHTNGKMQASFPVAAENIGNIGIIFEGVSLGNVSVYSIQPTSIYVGVDSENGSVDTCAINTNTEEILIKGSIDRESFDKYKQKELHLFAFDLSERIDPDSLTLSKSLSKSIISTEGFIFRIKFHSYTDERQLLYQKYAVAVKTENGFELIGNPICVTNPESYSGASAKVPKVGSGKGVYGESIDFMLEMGVSDTVLWVDIGKFFLQDSNGGSKFECGGSVYYYNTEYVNALDTLIKNYNEKNINVTLVFVVSDTGNDTLNRILIHKDADLNATYCAYNTADRSGLMYLRAVSEFFAQKYCKDTYVTRIVFGNCVAMASTNYNMGDKPLSIFVEEYARGLRTVYNTVKSYSSTVSVYTYIDDGWNRGLPFDLYTRYDGKAFLTELNNCLSDMGNINWGIAQNPYPYYVDDYFSYTDTQLQNTCDSERVSFKNIGVLSEHLASDELLFNGTKRDLIVIEKTFYAKLDEQSVTADYVYNCYKALNTSVSAYITDRNCNYNDAMKYIDTSLSLTASSFVPDVLGVATWGSVIDGFSEDNIIKRRIQNGEISLKKPDSKGSIIVSQFATDEGGWERYGFTERLNAGTTLLEKSDLLSLHLGSMAEGETRGMVKEFASPYDMSATPIIHFGINVASLPSNVNYASVSVVLVSGNDYYQMTGNVKEAAWVDVYCDFTRFSGLSKVDEIKILFHASENFYDSPQVLITAIEGISTEYDSETLANMLYPVDEQVKLLETVKKYAYPSLIVLIVICFTVFVLRRTLKRKIG